MANLFAYPFRVNPDGTVAKTPDGEDYYGQELANLIMTTPGERPLVPDYGITDPVFNNLNTVELLGKIEMFGPPVNIDDEDGVVVTWPKEGVANINIKYSRADTDDDDAMINGDQPDDYYDDNAETNPTENDFFGFNDRTDF